jgi:hypothetical protein
MGPRKLNHKFFGNTIRMGSERRGIFRHQDQPELGKGFRMPMRGKLAPPAMALRDDQTDSSAWAVVAFCAVGIGLSLYLASTTADLPALIMQYNLF